MSNHLKKYFIFTKNAAATLAASKGQILGRGAMYFVVVLLFSEVFKRVNGDGRYLWYVVITQFLIMATSTIAFEVAADIRSRQISIFLSKPVNYLLVKLYEALGGIIVKSILLGSIGFIATFYLTGKIPFTTTTQVLNGIILSFCSFSIYTLLCAIVGLLAFWLKDVKCLIYLNMTSTFCFGGLIVPLTNYPEIVKNLCFLTPYPWILYAPAQQLTFGDVNMLSALSYSLTWIVILFSLVSFIHNKLMHDLMENGI